MFQVNSRENHALFSSKDKSEKIKCRLRHFLFGALRAKCPNFETFSVLLAVHNQVVFCL